MRYSRALKVIILKKVMPPESRSVTEVSRETGINYQTIKNWIKQHKMTGRSQQRKLIPWATRLT